MPAKRQSGKTAAEETAAEVTEGLEQPAAETLPEERATKWRHPGFQRLRVDWRPEDIPVLTQAKRAVHDRMLDSFGDAYQIMYELYSVVRNPVIKDGEHVKDLDGFVVWEKSPTGNYVEDYDKLTKKEKENILFAITTRLFAWEQRAADIWGDAMFSKGMFEERFAIAFNSPHTGTIDDREAAGNIDAAEERYFAIYLSLYSRRADALVRALTLLAQRIRDTLQ